MSLTIRRITQMAKFIYDGLITDPKDPVYNREWTVTLSPTSKKNSKESSQEKNPPKPHLNSLPK
jgi:hypothetical protein